ncbi:phenylalanine--tRNA ligase subunit beta [bacterium]|nr:phenylalanine--tRNA ligase subunit beta [bacterium]
MLFSYNWLKEYIKGKLPEPKKLADILNMHFFEVEGLERKGRDWVLDIDILPNRGGDCLSHLGVAREIGAIINSKYQAPSFKLKEDKKLKTKDFIRVQVKNSQDCPRYTARVVTGVKVGSSPKWLKERLEICGLRSINNIVDITNYVMLETGQPLHAFDFEKISNTQNRDSKLEIKNIIVRKAKKNEKIVTLDEEEYDLDDDVLVIADNESPLAIAGVKGGKKAEISKETRTIVIESANFNSNTIQKVSRKLNLKTEASLRFENSLDPNLTSFAIDKAAYLIQKIAGGKITGGIIDFYPKKILPKRVKLDLDYLERLLGTKIPEREAKNILKKLEFEIVELRNRKLIVKVPTFRQDITIPEDLIEEIGRIYGFDKIAPVFPKAALIPPKRNLKIFWENIVKDILKELGFTEVYNYSFLGEKEAKIFGYLTGKGVSSKLIELKNPMTLNQKYLRPSLIPYLLKNVKTNINLLKADAPFSVSQIKIFEIGKIFQKPRKEKTMLGGVITGDSFYEAKGVVDLLLNKLGISNIWYDEFRPTPEESEISIWHPKKCAEIKVDNQEIGFLGEISPKILRELEIPRLSVFDIDFEVLIKLASEEHEYQPISRYPATVRDLAIIVPRGVLVAEILNKINAAGGPLVRDVDLFDIYEGEGIEEGKKSLAFHIIYQAEDRTLSSKEVNKIHQKIIKNLEKNPEWQVRK